MAIGIIGSTLPGVLFVDRNFAVECPKALRACLNFTLCAANRHFLNLPAAKYCKIALLFCNILICQNQKLTIFATKSKI
jgi:hypothetical protein